MTTDNHKSTSQDDNLNQLFDRLSQALEEVASGNFDYNPQFDVSSAQGALLSARFSEMIRTVKNTIEQRTEAQRQTEAQYYELFEQTKETLAETRALYLASRSLTTFRNLSKMLENIVDSVASALPADTVTLITVNNGEMGYVSSGAPSSTDGAPISMEYFDEGLCGWVYREGKPALAAKGIKDPRESIKMQRLNTETGVGARAIVPIGTKGAVVGTLAAYNRTDQRDFTERDVRLMTAMATHIASAIGNAELFQQSQQEIKKRTRAEQALLKERDLLQSLMDNVPDYIYFKDRRSHYVRSNTAHATRLLGVDNPQDVIGKTDFDFFSKEDAQAFYDQEQTLFKTGEAIIDREIKITDKHGKTVWLVEHKMLRHNEAGRLVGLVGVARDITHLKEVETALAKRATELETVAKVGVSVSKILNTDELLQQVVDLTKSKFELYHAHIYILADGILRLAAGADEVGRQMRQEGWRILLDREKSLVVKAAQGLKTIIVDDVRLADDYYPNPWLTDTRSEMAIPLIIGTDILGVLDVQSEEVGYFSSDDTMVYELLAAQVSVAIQNARLFSQSESTLIETETLYKVSRALNTIDDLPTLLSAVTDLVVESLSATWATLITIDTESNVLQSVTTSGMGAEEITPKTYEEVMDGLGGWAIEQQTPALSFKGEPDSRESQFLQKQRLRLGIGSVIAMPLFYRGKTLGILSALNPLHKRNFTRQDLILMEAIGNQVSAAIENRNLFLQTEKRATQEQAIREISEKLRAAPNLDILLKIATQELGNYFDATHAVLELGMDS